MASSSSTTTTGGAGNRDGTAKATVANHISQADQSTSNLHLMQQSSPAQMASSSSTTTGGAGNRDGTAKAAVADHISQAVQSTSNLLHLMQQSSPAQAHLVKLPKNLLLKTSTIKNTAQVLQQLPQVISSLDAHTEDGLHSVPHLKTVSQLLANMESSQLNPMFHPSRNHEGLKDLRVTGGEVLEAKDRDYL